jgi:cytochrome P450
MMASAPTVPDHVAEHQLFDFDIYADDRLKDDLHAGFKSLHAVTPDIFYTPRNGGHWVVTRFDLISHIMRDSEHFSNRQMDIPKTDTPFVMIPLNLDPPDHAPYRAVLVRYFSPKAIGGMEDTLRGWANRLIDGVIDDGRCDFVERLGAAFPVSIFMEMMGLPMERFEEFRRVVVEFFSNITVERRVELTGWIFNEMEMLIRARMEKRENDLISRLIEEPVRGRSLTLEELKSICFLLFIAGLDTVANMMSFAFHHLASDEELQERLAKDPAKIPDFVEESLRRYAIVNGTRIVKKDFDFGGASFREGDMVACSLPMAGMDERKNPEPLNFDIDRQDRSHLAFSIGPHVCVGNYLARAEMRIFTEEWLKRISRFRVASGFRPEFRAGLVMALNQLPLEWTSRLPCSANRVTT